tara:strand:+ start:61 stop:642 length:582 start_codon:yes stop_codon:yes gene_type:complete
MTSIFDTLGLVSSCDEIDILRAARDRVAAIEKSDHVLKEEMKSYVLRACGLLISPAGRDLANMIHAANQSYVSSGKAQLIMQSIKSYHATLGRELLDASLFSAVATASKKRKLSFAKKLDSTFSCRWCSTPIHKKDTLHTLLCKCSFRCGHEFCANEFTRVHKRCPICRTTLLKRRGVSKYMIFNTDKSYDIR